MSRKPKLSPDAVQHGLLLGRRFADRPLGADDLHGVLFFAPLVVFALVELRLGDSIFSENL